MINVIQCTECGGDSGVVDSRESEVDGYRAGSRRRRRECNDCQARFTTYELSRKTIEEMDKLNMLLLDLIKTAKLFDIGEEL